MKLKKYKYNPKTLQYEKIEISLSSILYRVSGFIVGTLFFAVCLLVIFWNYIEKNQVSYYKTQWQKLDHKYKQIEHVINNLNSDITFLEKKDNEIYRVIFQAQAVPDSVRENYNNKRKIYEKLNSVKDYYDAIEEKVYLLESKLLFQRQSYADIEQMIANKEKLLAAMPAIQPISNHDLQRIASGFGYRIDPVYKTIKFHEGLDFTAPEGTPIYATADGVIVKREFNFAGYGNHIVIDHGFGYRTLYAHLSSYNTTVGQKVKRGHIIGYVGNTGKSVGPHCHYEVVHNNAKVNPVYFFYSDITPEQFESIVLAAETQNQALD